MKRDINISLETMKREIIVKIGTHATAFCLRNKDFLLFIFDFCVSSKV